VVILPDADDALLPTASEATATLFAGPDVVKVHWSLEVVDRAGQPIGKTIPAEAGLELRLRLRQALEELARVVPPGNSYLLADQAEWDMGLADRRAVPFPEKDGRCRLPPLRALAVPCLLQNEQLVVFSLQDRNVGSPAATET
jgi:hypothetical protein